MKYFATKILKVQKGEGQLATMLFMNIFLIIGALLIVKPVSNSLFILNLGVGALPWGFIWVALLSGLLMYFYLPLAAKTNLTSLLNGTHILFIVSLGAFWLWFRLPNLHFSAYYAFYIWVSLFGVVSASQFWLLCNRVLNPRQAKRLFGLIGAGGIAGGIFGGYLTTLLVEYLGARNMPLLSVLFLVGCLLLNYRILCSYRNMPSSKKRKPLSKTNQPENLKSTFRLMFNSRHVFYIACLVVLGVVAATLSDYIFRSTAAQHFTGEDDLALFFGFWQSNLSILALAIQLLLTTRLIAKLGVASSLAFLPGGMLAGSLAFLFFPGIISAIFLKLSDGSLKQSINKSGMELLYFPVPQKTKKQIKAFIDVFLDNAATGLAGVFLLLLPMSTSGTFQLLCYILLGICLIWLVIIFLLRSTYIQSFGKAIDQQGIIFEDPANAVDIKNLLGYLEQAIASGKNKRILYMLDLLNNYNHPRLARFLPALLKSDSLSIKARGLEIAKHQLQFNETSIFESIIKLGPHYHRIEAYQNLLLRTKDKAGFIKNNIDVKQPKRAWPLLLGAAREKDRIPGLQEFLSTDPDIRTLLNQALKTNDQSPNAQFFKTALAELVGLSQIKELYPYLEKLLEGRQKNTLLQVIPQISKTQNSHFCKMLLDLLSEPGLVKSARLALVEMDALTQKEIDEGLSEKRFDEKVLQELPIILGEIANQRSIKILEKHFPGSSFPFYQAAIKALTKTKKHHPELIFQTNVLRSEVIKILKDWLRIHYIQLLIKNPGPKSLSKWDKDNSARKLWLRASEDKKEQLLELVFRLLGICHKQGDLYNAYLGIKSSSSRLNADALEFLDALLPNAVKQYLIPILEKQSVNRLIRLFQSESPIKSTLPEVWLMSLIEENDPWLAACSLYLLIQNQVSIEQNIIVELMQSPFGILRESAGLVPRHKSLQLS